MASQIDKLLKIADEPVDGASVAFVRISFAAVMIFWLTMHIVLDKITTNYYEPSFLFPYTGFDWVQVWPGRGLHLHFLIVLVAACGMLFGVFYRFSSIVFAIGFCYIFLLDKATYQNHYYFVCLLSILFVVCPTYRGLGFDTLRLKTRQTIPRWSLWLFQFQIGLVYFFGGIAKINWDWICGYPMVQVLETKQNHLLIGPFCTQDWFVTAFVWSGMLFDLFIVGLLLYRRTRVLGFCMCLAFHLLNASLFRIGIFPWLMIFLTTIYFSPDWPRRLLGFVFVPLKEKDVDHAPKPKFKPLLHGFLIVFVALQTLLPLRHLLVRENTNWTERHHHFSWHMKLRGKNSAIRFYTIDEDTQKWARFDLKPHLKLHQLFRMSRDPFMIRDFALFIDEFYRAKGIENVTVRAFALSSLNGRTPQLMIDPQVDLTQAELPDGWIMPLEAPIGGEFNVPIGEWEQVVMKDPIMEEYINKHNQLN